MPKIRNDDSGFGGLESLLIIVIVVMIAAIGWYVVHSLKNINNSYNSASATSTSASPKFSKDTTQSVSNNVYAGWKTYNLQFEQATFKYPPNWTVSGTFTNDSDMVNLTGPGSFYMNIDTGGLGHPSNDGAAFVVSATPVTFVGKSGFYDYVSTTSGGPVNATYLSQSSTQPLDTFPSKASGENETPGGNFLIMAAYNIGDASQGVPLSAAKADPNYQDALLVIESITY